MASASREPTYDAYHNIDIGGSSRDHLGHNYNNHVHNYAPQPGPAEDDLKTQALLAHLAYPKLGRREKEVHDVEDDAYDTAFYHREAAISEWLSNDGELFWVAGRAGSGKSTFMKVLKHHPRTKKLLEKWAGDR